MDGPGWIPVHNMKILQSSSNVILYFIFCSAINYNITKTFISTLVPFNSVSCQFVLFPLYSVPGMFKNMF